MWTYCWIQSSSRLQLASWGQVVLPSVSLPLYYQCDVHVYPLTVRCPPGNDPTAALCWSLLPAVGICLGRLLESAREEAEKLESAIGIVKIELSKAPDSSQLGQLLLEQHAGLWELRKMKEKQIGKLLDSIAAEPQPQASHWPAL